MNQIIIDGNLGSDIEIKQVKEYQIATFSLAYTPWSKTKGKGETIWFRVVAWGDKGSVAAENFTKGDTIQVIGEFALSTYTAKDGTEKSAMEIIANTITAVVKPVRRLNVVKEDVPGW